MRISVTYCDLCKKKVDTHKMSRIELTAVNFNDTKEERYNGEICYTCTEDIKKKLTTTPLIKVEPKEEPVYRTPLGDHTR